MVAEPKLLRFAQMIDLERVLDSMATSVMVVDKYQTLYYLNVAAETLLGVSRNQAKGRTLRDQLRSDSELIAVVDRAAEIWQPYARRELLIQPVGQDGDLIVDCTVAPFEEVGMPAALLVEISDATQHQR